MQKPILLLIFFALFFPINYLYSADRCLTIDWYSSPDSNTSALGGYKQPFAMVNKTWINFNLVPGSTVTTDGKVTASTSKACFSSDILKIGNNVFHFAFSYSNTQSITGSTSATFTLEKGNSNSRLLCKAQQGGGSVNGFECSKDVSLALSEVDPEAGAKIKALQDQENHLKAEIDRLEQKHPSTDELRAKLDEIAAQDLEAISGAELEAISEDLKDIGILVESLKEDLEKLKSDYQKDLSDKEIYLKDLEQQTKSDLKNAGVDLSDPKIFEKFEVAPFLIPQISTQPITRQTDKFDPLHNPYVDLSNLMISRLESASAHGDSVEIDLLIEAWTENIDRLDQYLKARMATVSTAEQKSFNDSIAVVKIEIDKLMDQYGFFKGHSSISIGAEQVIARDIRQSGVRGARSLRSDINSNSGALSENQKDALSLVEFLNPNLASDPSSTEGNAIRLEIYRDEELIYQSKSSPRILNAEGCLVLVVAADLAYADQNSQEGQSLLSLSHALTDLNLKQKTTISTKDLIAVTKELLTQKDSQGRPSRIREYLHSAGKKIQPVALQQSAAKEKLLGEELKSKSPLWTQGPLKPPPGLLFDQSSLDSIANIDSIIESGEYMKGFIAAAPMISLLLPDNGKLEERGDFIAFNIVSWFADILVEGGVEKTDPWNIEVIGKTIPAIEKKRCADVAAAELIHNHPAPVRQFWVNVNHFFESN